jgi:5-methylcytosine-specific restriction endonuclease McrA
MDEISYLTLVKNKNEIGEPITYSDKLLTHEWKTKRELIINRDKKTCTNCKSVQTTKNYGTYERPNTPEEQEEYIKQVNDLYRESVLDIFKPFKGNLFPDIIKNVPLGTQIVEKPTILHVHHKYYINDKLPWEYSNDALITLCQICHQDVHDNTEIPVYLDNEMTTRLKLTKCSRCNGSGYLKEYHYHQNGICFRCNGNKYDEFIE